MLFLSLLVPFVILLEGAVRAKALPQIFIDLTIEEFAQKVSEMAQLAGNASSAHNNDGDDRRRRRRHHDANIQKRAPFPVGGEINNSPVAQMIIEELATICVAAFGPGHRPVSGKTNSDTQIEIGCSLDGNTVQDLKHDCTPSEAASTVVGHNLRNGVATFGFCGININVKTREDHGILTNYFGSWYPQPPNTPDAYNDFVAMQGLHEASFLFGAPSFHGSGYGHTWSCLSCPGGLLKITSNVVTFAAGVSHKYSNIQHPPM